MEDQHNNNKPAAAEVRIESNGPIVIRGRFRFRESSGKITEGEQELFICCCGESASKPWCDGSHKCKGVAR